MTDKNYLINLDRQTLDIIRVIGFEADKVELLSYVVGGVVRDIILKVRNLDLDIVVEGEAIPFAQSLAEQLGAQIQIYPPFKTATITLPSGRRIDLTSARRERYPQPGQLPIVEKGSLKEDLFRRDFTVNAMAIALNPGHFGELIDEFGGFKDIKRGWIRVLHDQSFKDDPTRILRAVRFEQRFNFKIEGHTLRLLAHAFKERYPGTVKPPRYFAEIKKILKEAKPCRCINRLHQLKGLGFLHLAQKIDRNQLKRLERNLIIFQRTPKFADEYQSWLFYMMVMVKDKNPDAVSKMSREFHLRKEEEESLQRSLKSRALTQSLESRKLKASEVYDILRPLDLNVIIYLRLMTSKIPVKKRIDDYLTRIRFVKLFITGEDLENLGVPPGRKMKEILSAVLKEKIDQSLTNKYQELNAAQCLIKKMEVGR